MPPSKLCPDWNIGPHLVMMVGLDDRPLIVSPASQGTVAGQ